MKFVGYADIIGGPHMFLRTKFVRLDVPEKEASPREPKEPKSNLEEVSPIMEVEAEIPERRASQSSDPAQPVALEVQTQRVLSKYLLGKGDEASTNPTGETLTVELASSTTSLATPRLKEVSQPSNTPSATTLPAASPRRSSISMSSPKSAGDEADAVSESTAGASSSKSPPSRSMALGGPMLPTHDLSAAPSSVHKPSEPVVPSERLTQRDATTVPATTSSSRTSNIKPFSVSDDVPPTMPTQGSPMRKDKNKQHTSGSVRRSGAFSDDASSSSLPPITPNVSTKTPRSKPSARPRKPIAIEPDLVTIASKGDTSEGVVAHKRSTDPTRRRYQRKRQTVVVAFEFLEVPGKWFLLPRDGIVEVSARNEISHKGDSAETLEMLMAVYLPPFRGGRPQPMQGVVLQLKNVQKPVSDLIQEANLEKPQVLKKFSKKMTQQPLHFSGLLPTHYRNIPLGSDLAIAVGRQIGGPLPPRRKRVVGESNGRTAARRVSKASAVVGEVRSGTVSPGEVVDVGDLVGEFREGVDVIGAGGEVEAEKISVGGSVIDVEGLSDEGVDGTRSGVVDFEGVKDTARADESAAVESQRGQDMELRDAQIEVAKTATAEQSEAAPSLSEAVSSTLLAEHSATEPQAHEQTEVPDATPTLDTTLQASPHRPNQPHHRASTRPRHAPSRALSPSPPKKTARSRSKTTADEPSIAHRLAKPTTSKPTTNTKRKRLSHSAPATPVTGSPPAAKSGSPPPPTKRRTASTQRRSSTSHTTPHNNEGDTRTDRKCVHCNGNNTPMWRRGPDGPKTLCNACGVKFMLGKLERNKKGVWVEGKRKVWPKGEGEK
ncbi:uncharacterized protein EV422DRAFT_572099 [Fimicolochytrium jonesii]|uniref:uncharacterized protein n=1 Tax=Fimicolochytrium jonesii TaxID=1396493 RepID=UPI0022FDDF29|nr:uncharacterized protein EV422DRAFT_572099 [Fimicolochytrium jonesii]KAI8816038.1 hypothetical protein EV422DRAFT_572099 [Fimicolochytrium jonesii]